VILRFELLSLPGSGSLCREDIVGGQPSTLEVVVVTMWETVQQLVQDKSAVFPRHPRPGDYFVSCGSSRILFGSSRVKYAASLPNASKSGPADASTFEAPGDIKNSDRTVYPKGQAHICRVGPAAIEGTIRSTGCKEEG
jgi:hypothetical protein